MISYEDRSYCLKETCPMWNKCDRAWTPRKQMEKDNAERNSDFKLPLGIADFQHTETEGCDSFIPLPENNHPKVRNK